MKQNSVHLEIQLLLTPQHFKARQPQGPLRGLVEVQALSGRAGVLLRASV